MRADEDLRPLLEAWPYDAARNVRVLRLPGGREVLQVRQPAGIEQYEMDGRPDGQRPHGVESCLDYHLARLARAEAAGKAEAFRLTPAQCQELFAEGTLYYHRYLHLFQM